MCQFRKIRNSKGERCNSVAIVPVNENSKKNNVDSDAI